MVTLLPASLQGDGAPPPPLPSSSSSSSRPPARPASPKLGNFGALFDLVFGGTAAGAVGASAHRQPPPPVDPVKARRSPTEPAPRPSPLPLLAAASADSPAPSRRDAGLSKTSPSYAGGFLSGLDLSAIDAPRTPSDRAPVSLLLDTEDESSEEEEVEEQEDDDDDDDDDDVVVEDPPPRRSKALVSSIPGTASASRKTATKTTKAALATLAAKAAVRARVAAVKATPPRAARAVSTSPKRNAGLVGDLPYPLGAVPPPILLPGAGSNSSVQPLVWCTRQEKLDLLEAKLQPEYKRDLARLRRSSSSSSSSSPSSSSPSSSSPPPPSPIHVFVDLSNIVIGFYSRIRADRGIPTERKMRAPPFFFEGFARILERGRPVARRVTAGSAPDSNNRASWPAYMREADALGYEMNILSRVSKSMPSPRLRTTTAAAAAAAVAAAAAAGSKSPGYGHHRKSPSRGQQAHAHALDDSSDDGPGLPPPSTFKIGEQAVDEILHLKMCHSFLDHEAGTMVLATGDAAEAEFSDGFLKHVERALGRGWCVELLSWKMGISNAWRELERAHKGRAGRFRILELDRYAEDLLAVFSDD